MTRTLPGAAVASLVPDEDAPGPAAPAVAVDPGSDALLAIPFEELVRRRLRPVIETLAGGSAGACIYREVLEQVEHALLGLALETTGGNQQRAAGLLGISRNTLRAKWTGPTRGAAVGGNGRGCGTRA
jgi:DNA-binding protein Fis